MVCHHYCYTRTQGTHWQNLLWKWQLMLSIMFSWSYAFWHSVLYRLVFLVMVAYKSKNLSLSNQWICLTISPWRTSIKSPKRKISCWYCFMYLGRSFKILYCTNDGLSWSSAANCVIKQVFPVGKIAEKTVWRSAFKITWVWVFIHTRHRLSNRKILVISLQS